MAVNVTDPQELSGATVLGEKDAKLGKVDNVFLDEQSGRAEWAAVKTGMFGSQVSLVPLTAGQLTDHTLRVPYTKDQVQQAPHHDPGQDLSVDDEKELFTYYGVSYEGDTATATDGQDQQARRQAQEAGQQDGQQDGRPDGRHEAGQQAPQQGRRDRAGDTGVTGRDVSGPTTDDAMTRSEEELHVGTQSRESGRARLRKHVVSEQQTVTVPVSHEEVTLEREPITEANRGAAQSGANISEEEHEVALHAEEPVVTKETVAKERVRMGTQTVTEQQTVTDQVRKEEIDAEGEDGDRTGR